MDRKATLTAIGIDIGGRMSALGNKLTSCPVRVMSVVPLKADIHQRGLHVS
jgi:hypothetical protein